jgi:integrase
MFPWSNLLHLPGYRSDDRPSGMIAEQPFCIRIKKKQIILLYSGTTKNGEKREILINQNLRDTLKKLPGRIDSPYVFTDKEGKRFGDVKRSFKTALRKSGIKDFRFHDMRHTLVSHLVMAGVDITTVKELLGHKTLTMTLRYAYLAPSHKVKAVDILDGVIGTQEKSTIPKLHKKANIKIR